VQDTPATRSQAPFTAIPPYRPTAFGGGELKSELAACVWIPLFALRAEEERQPELATRPAAVLSPDDTRRVWQISSLARRSGVKPGMTVSQAIGLCPSLTLCEPDPVHYDERFASLLLRLSRVSPVVEPVELGKAFVGVDGLERLFGSPERQLAVIQRSLSGERRWRRQERQHHPTSHRPGGSPTHPYPTPAAGRQAAASAAGVDGRCDGAAAGLGGAGLGCRGEEGRRGVAARGGDWAAVARLGWARGKFAAWVAAARARPGAYLAVSDAERPEFLAAQSVAVLPLSPDTLRRLWQLDVRTLEQLAHLPREALISQFGREGKVVWELATGARVEPVVGRTRPEPIVEALDYLNPVADRGLLLHGIGLLVERALRHPRRAGWRVQTVRARARLEHGASWLVEVMLKDPSAERDRIMAPLGTRLEQIPPTGAVERLTVELVAFTPGTSELQLFARDARSSARAGQRRALRAAAEEIRARLKRSLLYHVVEVHPWSRIPERRYALIDFEP